MTAVCSDCGGSGWLDVDGSPDSVRPCGCRGRRSSSRLFSEAGVPERYQGCRLSGFQVSDHDQLVEALSRCRHYVDNFLSEGGDRRFRDSGLLFSGRPGVGKTHLAVAVLHELIAKYRIRGRFVDFTSLTQQLQSSLDPGNSDTAATILEPLESAEVLVVDELGSGSKKLVSWTNEVSYSLINKRYQRRLPTLFTTNYRLEEVEEKSLDRGPDTDQSGSLSHRISARLVSRLYEMAQPILLDSVSDYRRLVRAHQHHA